MSVAERIRDVIEQSGLTIEEFSEKTGSRPQRVKDVLRGKQKVPEDMLVAIVDVFHVDANWLLESSKSALSADEIELLNRYRSSSLEIKTAALRVLSDDKASRC